MTTVSDPTRRANVLRMAMVSVGIRLPEHLHAQVQALAATERRSVAQVVALFVEDGLERVQLREAQSRPVTDVPLPGQTVIDDEAFRR